MKKNIHQNLWGLLKSKAVLGVSAGMILMSCGAYTGGYSETDGVYYDPNTDTLPEGTINNQTGNRVGEYYDYQDSTSIIEKSRQNELTKKNRYNNDNWSNDNAKSSDWGIYSGSETHYNSWGNPYGYGYGFFPRYGWGGYYGMSLGWGSPWGYGFYDPFFDFGPWGYNSYFSYYPWGYSRFYGYNPYYGYYSPYHYSPYGYNSFGNYYGNPYYGNNYYRAPQRKSGADGNYNTNTGRMTQPSSTMRNGSTFPRNGADQGTISQPRMRGSETMRNGNIERPAPTQRQMPQQERSQPRFENNRTFENRTFENRTIENRSYDSGGFRSGGGFNSGSSSSGSTSRGGGMRTGGGRF